MLSMAVLELWPTAAVVKFRMTFSKSPIQVRDQKTLPNLPIAFLRIPTQLRRASVGQILRSIPLTASFCVSNSPQKANSYKKALYKFCLFFTNYLTQTVIYSMEILEDEAHQKSVFKRKKQG
jgi:hypothetical protein